MLPSSPPPLSPTPPTRSAASTAELRTKARSVLLAAMTDHWAASPAAQRRTDARTSAAAAAAASALKHAPPPPPASAPAPVPAVPEEEREQLAGWAERLEGALHALHGGDVGGQGYKGRVRAIAISLKHVEGAMLQLQAGEATPEQASPAPASPPAPPCPPLPMLASPALSGSVSHARPLSSHSSAAGMLFSSVRPPPPPPASQQLVLSFPAAALLRLQVAAMDELQLAPVSVRRQHEEREAKRRQVGQGMH